VLEDSGYAVPNRPLLFIAGGRSSQVSGQAILATGTFTVTLEEQHYGADLRRRVAQRSLRIFSDCNCNGQSGLAVQSALRVTKTASDIDGYHGSHVLRRDDEPQDWRV
jgi:hypothetical protein